MKKFIALFALVAFVGVLTAPAATVTEKSNQVVLDQSFDKNLDKDKDKDKKKAAKASKTAVKAKAAEGSCGGCTEAAGCEGEAAKKAEEKGSCCGEKTEGKKTL